MTALPAQKSRFSLPCATCKKDFPLNEILECPVTYRSLCEHCYHYDDMVSRPVPRPYSPWPIDDENAEFIKDQELRDLEEEDLAWLAYLDELGLSPLPALHPLNG